jgi:hypothetical protein
MPSGATAGAGSATAAASSSSSSGTLNPFWSASNWYFEANNSEILGGTYQVGAGQKSFSVPLNTNGFLKDYRICVRSSGAVGGVPQSDGPTNAFANLTFKVPNGSEFFQDSSGFDHLLWQAFGRPWEGDPTRWFDWSKNINPSFTLKLAPEIRYTAGALANMDSRRNYIVAGQIATLTALNGSAASTGPTLAFASGIDTWAQPDTKNLLEQNNQQVPPGVALQVYRRKVTVPLNGAGSNNTIDARSLTGNLQRLIMLIVRDSNNVRQDYLQDPITTKIDDRTIGNFTTADLFGQFNDFYGTDVMPRPVGVYIWPRFLNSVGLAGQGWLPTDGSTKEMWTTSTISTATNVPGTVDIDIEDMVPLTDLPYDLVNI